MRTDTKDNSPYSKREEHQKTVMKTAAAIGFVFLIAAIMVRNEDVIKNIQKSVEEESEAAYMAELSSELEEISGAYEIQESELSSAIAKNSELQSEYDVLNETALAAQDALTQLEEETSQLLGQIWETIQVKATLLDELQEEFTANDLDTAIDTETGTITFDSSVLFGYNESTLTEDGKVLLDNAFSAYLPILLKEEYRSYLSEIIIAGYTDPEGSYEYNLPLSWERAYAVTSYLLSVMSEFLNDEEIQVLESLLTVSGRSKSDPVVNDYNFVDSDASRRVEIKFRLKDEELLTQIQEIMEETIEEPDSTGSTEKAAE